MTFVREIYTKPLWPFGELFDSNKVTKFFVSKVTNDFVNCARDHQTCAADKARTESSRSPMANGWRNGA